jgi:hypothetical protein
VDYASPVLCRPHQRQLFYNPIHRSSWRNCPKRVGGVRGAALQAAKERLFGPFALRNNGQIHHWCVARTPFRMLSGRCVLRSSHSPGPTLMSIHYLDRQPSGVTLRGHAPPHRRRLQKGVTFVVLDSLVAGSASGYIVRSLQLYIHERRALATYLRCRRTRR